MPDRVVYASYAHSSLDGNYLVVFIMYLSLAITTSLSRPIKWTFLLLFKEEKYQEVRLSMTSMWT